MRNTNSSQFGLTFLALFAIVVVLDNGLSIETCVAQRRQGVFKKPSEQPGPRNPPNQPATPKTGPGGVGAPTPASPAAKTANADGEDEEGLAEEYLPTVVTEVVNRDNIEMVCTWYPAIPEEELIRIGVREPKPEKEDAEGDPTQPKTEAGEEILPGTEVAPFILVHDWDRGSRKDLAAMANFLQMQGHAVIVPDLRGHGESIKVKGSQQKLDYRKFKRNQVQSAVGDIDQCKRFLIKKNNEKELNIDLLNVVAVGDSCHLAMAWTIADWSWSSVAGVKQGKDVKSLTLFSPSSSFESMSLKKAMKSPLISGRKATPLPMFVIWGRNAKDRRDPQNFVRDLRKNRPEASDDSDLAQRWLSQDLFHYAAPTDWRGAQLAGEPQAKTIWESVNNFVAQKVLTHRDKCPWKLRGKDAILKD